MSENLSFIIILEFVAPFAILSVVLLMALLNTNKKSKKGLSKLLQAVQGGEEDYKLKLKEFLKNSGTSEDQIDDLVQKFCKSRRAFFKRALSAISHSDSELLTGLGGQFGQFSDLYHQLSITSVATTTDEEIEGEESDDEATNELEATYKVVKRENKRLKAEVHVSVSALNSLFNEYASMFGETDQTKSDMSVEEVLDAMEKFTKGDFKPDNITGDIPPEDVAAAEAEKKAQKQPIDEETESTDKSEAEDSLNPKLEDIVVEDDVTFKQDDEVDTKQEQKEEEAEPNWDEAFEETGDTPDEAAMDEVKKAEETEEKLLAEAPTQQTEESEPNWDEAFEETGDTPDATAAEQVKKAEQEEQAISKQESSSEEVSDLEKPPKPE